MHDNIHCFLVGRHLKSCIFYIFPHSFCEVMPTISQTLLWPSDWFILYNKFYSYFWNSYSFMSLFYSFTLFSYVYTISVRMQVFKTLQQNQSYEIHVEEILKLQLSLWTFPTIMNVILEGQCALRVSCVLA